MFRKSSYLNPGFKNSINSSLLKETFRVKRFLISILCGFQLKITEPVKESFCLIRCFCSCVCVDVCLALCCLQGANILLNDYGEVKLGRWKFAPSALHCISVVNMRLSARVMVQLSRLLFRLYNIYELNVPLRRHQNLFCDGLNPTLCPFHFDMIFA